MYQNTYQQGHAVPGSEQGYQQGHIVIGSEQGYQFGPPPRPTQGGSTVSLL